MCACVYGKCALSDWCVLCTDCECACSSGECVCVAYALIAGVRSRGVRADLLVCVRVTVFVNWRACVRVRACVSTDCRCWCAFGGFTTGRC